ncbi:MAG: rhamnan synthesis F family protein [Lachnospiraceae bacterium]
MQSEKSTLGILFLENNPKIIDDYIFFLLDNLKNCVDKWIVISSNVIEKKYVKHLLQFSADIYYPMIEQGKEIDTLLEKYEQYLLIDDSCFGPMYSIKSLLQEFITQATDYWELVPLHLVIIKNKHELSIRQHFMTIKYIKKGIIQTILQRLNEMNLKATSKFIKEGVANKIDPFVCEEIFMESDLNTSSCEVARETLEAIEHDTDYNTKLIWDHLLRMYNVQEIKNALHLEYIVPWNYFCGSVEKIKKTKVAIIFHLHYEDLMDESFMHLDKIPRFMDVYITTTNKHIKQKAEKHILSEKRTHWSVLWKENRGRDVSALLVACHEILMKYEFLCFVHDKKSASYLKKESESKSFQYNIFENTVKSEDYMYNVLQCFIDNPRLGVLTPPEPYYASLLGNLGASWGRCFEVTKNLAKQLQLDCKLEEEKLPITISTTFWCRTVAMRPLFEHQFQYEDFPEEPMASDGTFSHAIERILPYVAQHERYYTGVIMNNDYASLRGNGLQMLLIEALNELRKDGIILLPKDVKEYRTKNRNLIEFCKKYKYVYIYGAGDYGKRCSDILDSYQQCFQGYIVSDGRRDKKVINGHRVFELSEIENHVEECGIILALNYGNCKEVQSVIEQKGYIHRYNMF